ncbi:hypothetical protein SJAV_02800 [Sulfurisphaera javensis]|uniref:tRNA-guanine(15) transglycosylase-like domain-containing protein n=1 Tax=Sulfurisphaera javensis TaxID=2049879 RepID=A0AAT9GNF0_9CREN
MDVFLGVQDLKIPVWEFGSPIMINQLRWDSIPWKNRTWVDSGGYQIMKKGIPLNPEEIEKKYKILNAEAYINLDIPSMPCQRMDERNFKHFEYFYEKEIKVIPVIHGYNIEDINRAIDFYKQYTDLIAFGGIVPPSLRGGRKFVIFLYHYIRKSIKIIHVLGAGSPYMRKIFFNADSVDTATYRIKGANGLVIIPGKGERYVGNRKIVWNARRASDEEIEFLYSFLEKTKYPYPVILTDWVNRALINAWVMINSEYEGETWEIKISKEIDKLSKNEIEDQIDTYCKKQFIKDNT